MRSPVRGVVALVLVLAACGGGNNGARGPGPSAPSTVAITYTVTGVVYSPEVVYQTATGSVTEHPAQGTGGAVNLDKTYNVTTTSGSPVSVSIESKFYGDKSVGCRITGSDGKVIATNSANGQFSKATCEGTAA